MSNAFSLNVGLTTSQKLTPQMQQAIRLLQLSSLELEQEVQQKLDSNPMLERDETPETDDTDVGSSRSLDEWTNFTNTKSDDTDFDSENDSTPNLQAMDNEAIDSDWSAFYGDDVNTEYGATTDDESQFLGETSLCIQDHIRWQISFKKLSDLDNLIAEHLIDSMDELGFIRTSIDDVYEHFLKILNFYEIDQSIEEDEILAVLKVIQSCSPVGVGARDLPECLLLQLNALTDVDKADIDKVKQVLDCAEHLKTNNIKALMNQTGLDMSEIKSALDLIRTLNPNPALSFVTQHSSEPSPDIPDILVLAKHKHKQTTDSEQTDSWRVLLNPQTLPKLKINQEYASLIKRGDESADNVYLKNNLTDAKLFIRSIEERNQNLLKVAVCIATRQQAFLLYGDKAMQPLTLKEVALDVELHESTVSRLTTNKTILTPQGLYPLKYFFSSHVSSTDGEVSSVAISAMIEEMISQENPKKPLSDSVITKRLEEKGVEIARRTVAKYREAMGIGSSSERKQKI